MNEEDNENETKVISEKEKLLKEALEKAESDYLRTEINLGVCEKLIKFYKEEINKEEDAQFYKEEDAR